MLHRMWGKIGFGKIMLSFVKIAIAAAAMAGGIYFAQQVVMSHTAGTMGRIITILVDMCVGVFVFFAAAFILRCKEVGELLRRKKPSQDAPQVG